DPLTMNYSLNLMSETLFTAALTLALLMTLAVGMGWWRPRPGVLVAAGVLWLVAVFTRSIAYYLLPMVGVALWFSPAFRSLGTRHRVWLTLLVCLPFALGVVTWQARNRHVCGHGEFTQVKGWNLLLYRGAGAMARHEGISIK